MTTDLPDTAAKAPLRTTDKPRFPRILWANAYCLLDTTSGASMAVRQLLLQLHQTGCEVSILGATAFDHPRGIERLGSQWDVIKTRRDHWVRVQDGPLTHQLLVTTDTNRRRMLAYEEALWFNGFMTEVERFNPDLICNQDNALLIRSTGLAQADATGFPHLPGLWAEPDEAHLIELMQCVVADYDAAMDIGRRGYECVRDAWTWRAQLGKVFFSGDAWAGPAEVS